MPSITLIENYKTFQFTLGPELGAGAQGVVNEVQETINNHRIVCKTINIVDKDLGLGYFSEQYMLRSALGEVKALRQLGYLLGYNYNKSTKQFIILMKHIPGVPETSVKGNVTFASFKALRKVHRKGMVHFDCGPQNYLVDRRSNESNAIDFGLAADYNPLACLLDVYRFVHLRMPEQSLPYKMAKMAEYYVKELLVYAKNNKMKMAQDLFIVATITLAAIGGVSTFGVAGYLARELMRRILANYFAEAVSHCAAGANYLANTFASSIDDKFTLYSMEIISEIIAGFLYTVELASSYYQLSTAFTEFASLYSQLSPQGLAFWQNLAKNLPLQELGEGLMGILPLLSIYHSLKAFAERNILPQAALVTMTDFNIYGMAKCRNFLNSFKHRPAPPAAEEPAMEHPRRMLNPV